MTELFQLQYNAEPGDFRTSVTDVTVSSQKKQCAIENATDVVKH